MTDERQGNHRKPEPSRALVPVEDARASAAIGDGRPLATFVAQILACHAKVPDFRQRRRGQPPAAAALYGAVPDTGRRSRFERLL